MNDNFLNYKESLEKEPEGDVKKRYSVGCYNADDWKYIHEELMLDGSLDDNIPTDCCTCVDQKKHSETRGVYLLTESESTLLKNNPKVKYVNIDRQAYRGTYLEDPNNLIDGYRWDFNVKNYRGSTTWINSQLSGYTPVASDVGRTGFQLYRTAQKDDPWSTSSKTSTSTNTYDTNTILYNQIEHSGTGKDVDVIVGDTVCWFGHIEFQDLRKFDSTYSDAYGPKDWDGHNVLKSGFSQYSSNGTCELLDLVLDSPYYLDPDYFDANSSQRLEIRWDGTTVPIEQVARDWWGNSSNRSSSSILGGSVINVPSDYTRANCNGSNLSNPTNVNPSSYHGTSCASQAYGRWHGWAYNANKWYVNVYDSYGVDIENYFDMMKLFHQYKPNRTLDNTKNPTISSNSWGYRIPMSNFLSGYYYHRVGTTGSGGIAYDIDDGNGNINSGSSPKFLTNFEQSQIRMEFQDDSTVEAGDELIDSGVIFIGSAGNTNQKLVSSDHPDYNNYIWFNDNTSLDQISANYLGYTIKSTVNRMGFPGQIGKVDNGNSVNYRTISIGALDNSYDSNGKERKIYYSNMGNHIDVYAPSSGTLASSSLGYGYLPFTSSYSYDDGATNSLTSYENLFSGTSAACPIATGLIATILENNRTWNYSNVKTYISSNIGTMLSNDFYSGTESTTADDTNWSDHNTLEGGQARILWNAPLLSSSLNSKNYFSPEGELTDHFITERWFVDQYIGDKLCTWGTNANGQLGNGNQITGTGSFHGIYFIDNASYDSWSDVKCGGDHTLAVTREKILYSWGKNFDGQLGNGTTNSTDEPSLTSLGSNFNRIKLISAGLQHSLAISTQKVLYAWGHNANGQLGLGNNNLTSTPTIVGTTYNWVQVSGKGFHTVAIKDDGTIWSTGYNQYGQLGLGDTTDRNTFTQIGDDTDWLTVSAGRNHTLAIKTNGTLWAWGANHIGTNNNVNEGILGIGAGSISYSTPQQIGNDISWISISAGGYHSAAIKRDGSLYCWGRNDDGQLGDNSQTSKNIPTLVYADNTSLTAFRGYEINLAQWKNVSCGEDHTTAVKLNGSAWAWGDNSNRQLGYDTSPLNIFKYPHKVEGSGSDYLAKRGRHFESVKRVSAGRKHSAFVTSGSAPEYYVTQG